MYKETYMWITGKDTLVACESPLEGEVPQLDIEYESKEAVAKGNRSCGGLRGAAQAVSGQCPAASGLGGGGAQPASH
jgi:hypothetical protein